MLALHVCIQHEGKGRKKGSQEPVKAREEATSGLTAKAAGRDTLGCVFAAHGHCFVYEMGNNG